MTHHRKVSPAAALWCTLLPIAAGAALAPAEAHASDIFDIFTAIAWCESHGLQFDPNIKPRPGHSLSDRERVFRSPLNKHWIGKFQINEATNGADARRLGFDIYTEAGNEAYAHHLYTLEGTSPWDGSGRCWRRLIGQGR